MIAHAQIIAALEQLEATRASSENKEWLASRKEIGRCIDPEAVDVIWQFACVLDPYGLCKCFPDNLKLIGREYFASSSDQEDWVSFDDLPPRTRDRLWQRMRAGHFDTNGVDDFNRMFFRPEGPAARFEGRVAIRSSDRSDVPLIVKPADPGSMIFQLITESKLPWFQLVGWIPAISAKRLCPLTTVGSIAAHFIGRHELRAMGGLKTFLMQSAGAFNAPGWRNQLPSSGK
jgi:hypothetical protein